MGRLIDLTGKQFGRLTVIAYVKTPGKVGHWRCRCECGNETLSVSQSLRTGQTASCGCLSRERIVRQSTRHGHSRRSGFSPTYQSWVSMLARCNHPEHFPTHGGRGIKVCERWHDFTNFLADMGERPSRQHSIDRFPNNDGDYEPGNCRWAVATQQARNKRNNRLLTVGGITKTLAEWAEIRGVDRGLIKDRLRLGWTEEDAVMAPILPSRVRK